MKFNCNYSNYFYSTGKQRKLFKNLLNNEHVLNDFKYEIKNFYICETKDVYSYNMFVYILQYFSFWNAQSFKTSNKEIEYFFSSKWL